LGGGISALPNMKVLDSSITIFGLVRSVYGCNNPSKTTILRVAIQPAAAGDNMTAGLLK
jgi:hypothetical protein